LLKKTAFRIEAVQLLNDIYKFSFCHRENALCIHYRVHPVNTMLGNNSCLLWKSCETLKYNVWAKCRIS